MVKRVLLCGFDAIIVKNLKIDTKLTPKKFRNPCFGET